MSKHGKTTKSASSRSEPAKANSSGSSASSTGCAPKSLKSSLLKAYDRLLRGICSAGIAVSLAALRRLRKLREPSEPLEFGAL